MLTIRFKKRSTPCMRISLLTLLTFIAGATPVLSQQSGLQNPSFQNPGFPNPEYLNPSEIVLPPAAVQQASGQQPVNPAINAGQRTAAKPVINSTENIGATFVALDSQLRQVFKGSEPRSLSELKALEEQQSKVAKAIEQVTVNVQQGSAQGSGVIITGDGYILTAAHVAGKPGRQAWVRLSDGTRVEATTLGMNRDKDAGLIKINSVRSTPWPHATIGRSQDLKVGQWCIAAGHPGGWQAERGNVIRVGRVLSIKGGGKGDKQEWSAHTLFTDCTLIGGDSGGPLFTLEGKLIGIHSRIGTELEDNMHVPIGVFADDWDRLKSGQAWGVLPGFRPMIGVVGSDDPSVVDAIVSEVRRGSPAAAAGIMVGDRISSFDGVKISTFAELQAAVQQTLPGDTVFIEIVRDGEVLKLPIEVAAQE